MKTSSQFKKYIWIIQQIYRSKGITLSDLNERWMRTEMSEGLRLDRNTFRRYKNELEEMFGLCIEVGKGYKYYIANDHVLQEDSVQNWLLSTLSMNNIISESTSVHDRIQIESVPEVRHLETLVDAMKESRRVRISYQKYKDAEPTERVIEPYFIKLHKRRWYVVAKQIDNGKLKIKNEAGASKDAGYRTFSFDRIVSVEMTKETFTMPENFDPKEYFADCFGVMRGGEKWPAQRIVLRAYGNEPHYMNDLPIHSSQRIIGQGDGYVDYEVRICPTSDFMGYILSRGKWLQVISPQSVADDVNTRLLEAAERYHS